MLKLPRTLRLDPSDAFVFARAAEPGEWAVTGSFLFVDADVAALAGKARAAFRAGFVGVDSLGFSTLVEIAEVAEAEIEALIEAFAGELLDRAGAPSREAARAAAVEEVDFAASLCQDEPGTILAMHRTFEDGKIREQFRTLHRREGANPGSDRMHAYARAFEFVEVEEPEERVDLTGLLEKRP